MTGKRANVLRSYHILIIRSTDGYTWEIRYGRNAKPVRQGQDQHATHHEALRAGEQALASVKDDAIANA